MSGVYRASAAPVVPRYLWQSKLGRLGCRVFGHRRWDLFAADGEPFPTICLRCGLTGPNGRSAEEYRHALEGFLRWTNQFG